MTTTTAERVPAHHSTFAVQVAAVAALLPPDRSEELRQAVICFELAFERERRFGYKPEFMRLPEIPVISFEERGQLIGQVEERYYRGLTDKRAANAAVAAIFAAWEMGRSKKHSSAPGALKRFLRDRDGDDCWLCHEPMGDDCTIEHKRAKAMGGTSNIANLALAHRECNRVVGHAGIAVKEAIRLAGINPAVLEIG